MIIEQTLIVKLTKRNKKHYKEIHDHDKNKEENLHKLQESVVTLTYKTSEYFIFKIYSMK